MIRWVLILLTLSSSTFLAASQRPPGDPSKHESSKWEAFKKYPSDKPQTERTLRGTVTFSDDAPVVGAVVTIRNTKTGKELSTPTLADGQYRFTGLDVKVDYEVQASFKKEKTAVRTLSYLNEAKAPAINFQLSQASPKQPGGPQPQKPAPQR